MLVLILNLSPLCLYLYMLKPRAWIHRLLCSAVNSKISVQPGSRAPGSRHRTSRKRNSSVLAAGCSFCRCSDHTNSFSYRDSTSYWPENMWHVFPQSSFIDTWLGLNAGRIGKPSSISVHTFDSDTIAIGIYSASLNSILACWPQGYLSPPFSPLVRHGRSISVSPYHAWRGLSTAAPVQIGE